MIQRSAVSPPYTLSQPLNPGAGRRSIAVEQPRLASRQTSQETLDRPLDPPVRRLTLVLTVGVNDEWIQHIRSGRSVSDEPESSPSASFPIAAAQPGTSTARGSSPGSGGYYRRAKGLRKSPHRPVSGLRPHDGIIWKALAGPSERWGWRSRLSGSALGLSAPLDLGHRHVGELLQVRIEPPSECVEQVVELIELVLETAQPPPRQDALVPAPGRAVTTHSVLWLLRLPD